MSAPVQVTFRPAPGGTSGTTYPGGTSGSTSGTPRGRSGSRPALPRKSGRKSSLGRLSLAGLTAEDWVIIAMLVVSLCIAISSAEVGGTSGSATTGTQAAPEVAASSAPASGGHVSDPTGTGGFVTATTAHGLSEIVRVFGPLHAGPTLRSAACWDKHAWNPTSDHPKGKGCDLVPGRIGTRAAGPDLDHGWALANWLRANAGPLHVHYVIWQGRIWSTEHPQDNGGWGRKYSGGGIYNPADVTGGHWDHVHVSFAN